MGKGAIVLGIVFIIFGIWLFFKIPLEQWVFFMYPLGSIILGIALIIFNKAEERIEERKDLKTKKSK